MRRNRIAEWGLNPKLVSILKVDRIFDPAAIAHKMNEDPEVLAKVKAGGGTRVMPLDVHIAKQAIEETTKESIDLIVRKDGTAKDLAAKAHEKTHQLVEDMGRVHNLFSDLLVDIPTLRERAMDPNGPTDKDGKLLYAYPVKELQTALKVIETGMRLIDQLKKDGEVQTYLNAGTVNVSNGFALDQVFDLVLRTGKALGHPEDEVVAAFAKAQSDPARTVIDAKSRIV